MKPNLCFSFVFVRGSGKAAIIFKFDSFSQSQKEAFY